MITPAQVNRLLTPVRASRIKVSQGQSYVPQYEVRAELSRVFGPTNWDSAIHDVTLIYEDPEVSERDGKTRWKVCYRAACTLTIRDYDGNQLCQYTEYHAEESAPQPSRGEAHALALTSVESYALRRACINLGDAFGLHLYNDGSLAPLVKGSMIVTDEQSPLYNPDAPPQPQPVITEEQRANLAHSLGAVEIPENGPGSDADSPAADDPSAGVDAADRSGVPA